VAELDREFGTMYKEVFGSLDERLTGILRSVGSATRSAGLLPGTYTYSAAEDRTTGYIRFGVRFSVEGEYQQLRRMLASLQSSPEFFVVETLTLTGDEDPVKRELTISVSVATFLAEADQDQLRRLTGGVGQISENGDG
jgi:Tfp pilus assembly protein PilO